MASRFGNANSRNSLFAGYDAATSSQAGSRTHSTSPRGGGYGYSPDALSNRSNGTHGPSGREQLFAGANGYSANGSSSKFRSATPNKKGQYSDAVLNELEGQNEEQFEGMSAKVQALKQLTSAIGDEIRDSTALAEKMNDSFANTRVRLKGTMNRMLKMAERTGVGWKAWVGFFAAVVVLFWYVRLS